MQDPRNEGASAIHQSSNKTDEDHRPTHEGEHPSDTETLVGETASSNAPTRSSRVQPGEGEMRDHPGETDDANEDPR
jgi:hypothetical protein